MIETFYAELPHGIRLHCRAAGQRGAPVLVFLHGFPEAAFVWDDMLRHFGQRYRCIAPNLRGYEQSSAPDSVQDYRVKHLLNDLSALIEREAGGGAIEALVAHDWGGAVAWTFAALQPQRLKRLVIINSPHPATFLRELQSDPTQQAASAYMNMLAQPGAEAALSENDFALLWSLFEASGAASTDHLGGGWLTEPVREQYRAVWRAGLTGPLNYYRASPLRPPTGPDSAVHALQFPPEYVTVRVPTHVVWAEEDRALRPSLLDGLEAYVPQLSLKRVPGATHWIVHERPQFIAQEIETALSR